MEPLTLDKLVETIETSNQSLVEGISTALSGLMQNASGKGDRGNSDDNSDDDPEDELTDEEVQMIRRHRESRQNNANDDDDDTIELTEDELAAIVKQREEAEKAKKNSAPGDDTDAAAIERMALIAQNQARFNKEQVLQMQMSAEQEGWNRKQFIEKLESVAIHPNPFAPNSFDEKEYDVGIALTEMMRGRVKDSSYEHSISDEILNKTTLPVYGANVLAIPWNQIITMNTKYGGTAGTDSAGTGVVEELLPIIRKDVPDPLDIVPLVTRVASTPGETNLVYITVPRPGMVAEPGDAGYTKTGDSFTSKVPMTPKLQVSFVKISRWLALLFRPC